MLKTLNKKFTDMASAVAFAECGEWEYARECVGDFEEAARSDKRKFIIMFEDKLIAQPFLDYVTNLSMRLCYDILFLHLPKRGDVAKRNAVSGNTLKRFFLEHYEQFAAAIGDAGIKAHYFVSTGKASESLKNIYHSVGHVEFAIVQQGVGIEEYKNLGLPLFVFRS